MIWRVPVIALGPSGLRWSGNGHPLSVRPPQPAAERASRPREVLLALLAICSIAAFNLFHDLGQPAHPVWDESYYLTAVARYELGYASFASHPPLGLMLLAAGDRLAAGNRRVDYQAIAPLKTVAATRMPRAYSYTGARCGSALFGVVVAGLFFLLMVELTGGIVPGLCATSPFLFDTALLTQFRAAQLDAFQLCFAVAALLALVKGDRRPRLAWLFGFGIACGLAAMVRANGILFLAGALLPMGRAFVGARSWGGRLAASLLRGGVISAGAAAAMLAVFLVHVAVSARAMPPSWPAAQADAPYVGPASRAYRTGARPLSLSVIADEADGYGRFMAADVAGVGLKDANGSSPWLWPLAREPIVYRWDSDGRRMSWLALVPNPAAWFLSLLGVVAGLAFLARSASRDTPTARDMPIVAAFLLLWSVLWASDIILAQTRVMYLYHYFLPLVLGWCLAAKLLVARCSKKRAGGALLTLTTTAVLSGYLLVSPLALHRPLFPFECRVRMLLSDPLICSAGA